MEEIETSFAERVASVQDYLRGYRFCVDMLTMREYEAEEDDSSDPAFYADLLSGNQVFWRARMCEIANLIDRLKNGREKLVLHYHYIKGMSIERTAALLGVSRRTAYRLHEKGLLLAADAYDRLMHE